MSTSLRTISSVSRLTLGVMVLFLSLVSVRQQAAVPVPAHYTLVGMASHDPMNGRVSLAKEARHVVVPTKNKIRRAKPQRIALVAKARVAQRCTSSVADSGMKEMAPLPLAAVFTSISLPEIDSLPVQEG